MTINLKLLFVIPSILLLGCATSPSATENRVVQAEPTKASLNKFENTDLNPPKSTAENHINIVINAQQVSSGANGEPLICREFQKTGSRLRVVKSCHTQSQWDAIKRETQDNIKTMYLKHGSDHG